MQYSFSVIVGPKELSRPMVYSLSAFSYASSASRKHAACSLVGFSLHVALARPWSASAWARLLTVFCGESGVGGVSGVGCASAPQAIAPIATAQRTCKKVRIMENLLFGDERSRAHALPSLRRPQERRRRGPGSRCKEIARVRAPSLPRRPRSQRLPAGYRPAVQRTADSFFHRLVLREGSSDESREQRATIGVSPKSGVNVGRSAFVPTAGKQKRPREAASLCSLRCELPARIAVFIDGDRRTRRRAQLHAVLHATEVVTHVPVIGLSGSRHVLATLHVLVVRHGPAATRVRTNRGAGNRSAGRGNVSAASATDLMAENTANDSADDRARNVGLAPI